ncbi:MAG: iron-containing alcohol dehydrogenase [Candidatus Hodarchaeota archaeon]
MPIFPSEAWLEAYVEKLNSNTNYKAAAKDWEGDFLFIIELDEAIKALIEENLPDEAAKGLVGENIILYMDLWHGECRSARVVGPSEDVKTAFTYAGPYVNWKGLIRKEIGPIKGLMQRKFRLTGNMAKVMLYVKAAQELVNSTTMVETLFIDEMELLEKEAPKELKETWWFSSPEIAFGLEALNEIDELEGKRAFIISDNVMKELGFVDLIEEKFKTVEFEVKSFTEVKPEPSLQIVEQGAELAREFQPDWIVGVGGGSVLDVSKGVWVSYVRPDLPLDSLNPFVKLGLREKARFLAIPTTSGTGSDASWAVVLTDTETKRKISLGSKEIIADKILLNPAFPAKMPPKLTASTGIDALSHVVEGLTSKWASDFSHGLCIRAIQLVFEYLPKTYENGTDMLAREKMHNAATLGGLAITNSQVGMLHSMAHSLGAILELPHGQAIAAVMKTAMEYTMSQAEEEYANMAHAIGIWEKDSKVAGQKFIEKTTELLESIGLVTNIKQLNISQEDFEANLDLLVDYADGDQATVASARIPTADEFRKLFQYAYEGKSVDF